MLCTVSCRWRQAPLRQTGEGSTVEVFWAFIIVNLAVSVELLKFLYGLLVGGSRKAQNTSGVSGGVRPCTTVTYDRLTKDGVEGGMAPELVAKIGDLVEAEGRLLSL